VSCREVCRSFEFSAGLLAKGYALSYGGVQKQLNGAKEVERLITMVPVGRNQKREKGFSPNKNQGGFNYEN
jgi:hypothetical protein